MPKSSQSQPIHCQQAGDFTVVSTAASETNKENLDQARNYQTLSQTVALERLQLLRMVELENSIFTQAFHLIETYYRPANRNLGTSEATSKPPTSVLAKRKWRERKTAAESEQTDSEPHHALGAIPMPRKRIHGLSKSYKSEYSAKMEQPGISKHFGAFHRDLLDWQLVFAPATDFPANGTNLAKELNFDALFDYEDAIASTANLLAISRQHSNLIDGLVLCSGPDTNSKSILTEYLPDQANECGAGEFRKLISLVEQLIKLKKGRTAQLVPTESGKDDGPGLLLSNWFKCDKSAQVVTKQQHMDCFAHTQQNTKDIQKEISAWEEFVDVVEISTK